MKVVCIDAGTSTIKAQVYDENGPISQVVRTTSSHCFDLKEGIIHHKEFILSTRKCLRKVIALLEEKIVDAIGLVTVGPSLAIFDKNRELLKVRNYNFQTAQAGIRKIIGMNLYKARGVGAGSQFTPEQIIQLKKDKALPENPYFSSIASILCKSLGGEIKNWTYPEASYNGLLDIQRFKYLDQLFQEFGLQKSSFPKFTLGPSGYLSMDLKEKYGIPNNHKIPIYCFGTDGPATQAYIGEHLSTFKIESTCAIRVMGSHPIFNNKPLIKGFPGVWNVAFKDSRTDTCFVSGATTNAGVNTIKHYFPELSDQQLEEFDEELIKLMQNGLPSKREVGIELPFEFGERDGIPRRSGILGKKPKDKILLYYAIKEGVLFNMMQRVLLVRKAQQEAGNKLGNKFLTTGAINVSKPWLDLAILMLSEIIDINDPELINPNYPELALTAIARGTFKKLGVKNSITAGGNSSDLNSLSFKPSENTCGHIKKRWQLYNEFYDKTTKV
ncbi:hypothetical protein JW766_00210 [Candidatus Dojkabacteria bacterium]|nr:hypothetical protein [Candidatus Dojkabacteria bacterium]